MDNLEKELATYNKNLKELSAQQGKYVLIKGDKIYGTYDSYNEAMAKGYEEIGLDESFFVKKISPIDQVFFFSRDIDRVCPV